MRTSRFEEPYGTSAASPALFRRLRRAFVIAVIVKASSGPRYVVGCRTKLDKAKLTQGTRVALDMTTLTIMRSLPREVSDAAILPTSRSERAIQGGERLTRPTQQVDPVVYNMLHEAPGQVDYATIGGLGDQIRDLREAIELPLLNPEIFLRVGIKPPKVGLPMR